MDNVDWIGVGLAFLVTNAVFWLGRIVGRANEKYWHDAFIALWDSVFRIVSNMPIVCENMTNEEENGARYVSYQIISAMKEAIDNVGK